MHQKPRSELLLRARATQDGPWMVLASSTSLYELEKIGRRLNCVNAFEVVENRRNLGHGEAHGFHVLKHWPK